MARYFSTTSRRFIALDPHVRARIAVRRVDIKQIRLVYFAEGLAQFRGSVFGAKHCSRRFFDALGLVETRDFAPGNPQPSGPPAAFAARAANIFDALFDSRRDSRTQTCRREVFARDKKILRETLAVGLKRDHAAGMSGQLRLQQRPQAIEAERHFRSRGNPARRGFAAKIKRIGNERRHPGIPIFEVDAFRGPAHQPRQPVARPRAERNSRIGLLQWEARHSAPMVSDCGAALDEIRHRPLTLRYHRWFAAARPGPKFWRASRKARSRAPCPRDLVAIIRP